MNDNEKFKKQKLDLDIKMKKIKTLLDNNNNLSAITELTESFKLVNKMINRSNNVLKGILGEEQKPEDEHYNIINESESKYTH